MSRLTTCTVMIGLLTALARGEAQTSPEKAAFVDADGDGINDVYQGMHRVRGKLRKGADWTSALSKLKLTNDQQARLKQASLDYRKSVDPLNTALNSAQTRLKEATQTALPDQKKVAAHTELVSALQSQIQKASTAYRTVVQGILTPEQWTEFNAAAREFGASRPAGMAVKKGNEDVFVDEDGDGICDGRGIGRKPLPPPGHRVTNKRGDKR